MDTQNIITARSRAFAPENHNCYEYYLKNTQQYGDYISFQHYGRNHMKSEFVADVEALAVYFSKELGLKRGDVYTVFMPTNVESMMTFMALNKLGIIVSFVHPLLPPESLKDILTETWSNGIMLLDMFAPKYVSVIAEKNLPCVICVPSTYAVPEKTMAKADEKAMALVSSSVKKYDVFPEIVTRYAGQTVETVKENAADTAVYMNGGGTTGKSRTIRLSNSALNSVVYMLLGVNTPVEEIGVDSEICSMPFFHAFGFCAGGLSAMHKGSRVIFIPKFDADKFVELMKSNKVVEFNGVPNMYKKLLAHPEFDGPHLKNVKVMYSGGDDLRPAFLEKFDAVMEKNGSKASICQGYGLTECCAVCTANRLWENKKGSIGKPMPGLCIEVWDENDKPVPTGAIGQMVMSGPTVMQGYLTPDGRDGEGLYTDENGTKWVKSGDLGYYDDEGYLYFVGRQKRVIVISGYNVYPGDIEKLLTEVPSVKESCAVQGFDGDKAIVRLYTVKANGADEEQCRKQIVDICSERLSGFCVPREIVFIDALPRTRLEKVDFMSLTQQRPE